jgi:hypothetical protein
VGVAPRHAQPLVPREFSDVTERCEDANWWAEALADAQIKISLGDEKGLVGAVGVETTSNFNEACALNALQPSGQMEQTEQSVGVALT